MSSFFGTSVTKKIVMALAGLFLIVFLMVHLGINFFLLSDDPTTFNNAAHFMASNPVIKVFEAGTYWWYFNSHNMGSCTANSKLMARPNRYQVNANTQTSFFSKYMIYTGIIILIFLIIHFVNFYFIKLGLIEGDHENFYGMAQELFKIPGYVIFYVVFIHYTGISFKPCISIGISNSWFQSCKVHLLL